MDSKDCKQRSIVARGGAVLDRRVEGVGRDDGDVRFWKKTRSRSGGEKINPRRKAAMQTVPY